MDNKTLKILEKESVINKIVINGDTISYAGEEITYDGIKALSGFGIYKGLVTITYSSNRSSGSKTVVPKDSIKVIDGMIISVSVTNDA